MVIAIFAAFVVPQVMAHMRRYRLGVAGRNVATAVQRARYLATSNNSLAGIFVAESQHLDVEQYDPEGKTAPTKAGGVNLPPGFTFAKDVPKQIAFDGRGVITPVPKDSPSIRINSSDGYYVNVIVSPTGQVTVSESQRDDSN